MQSEVIKQDALSGLTVVLCSDPIGKIWTSQSFKAAQRAVWGDKTRNATMTFVFVVLCSDPILLLNAHPSDMLSCQIDMESGSQSLIAKGHEGSLGLQAPRL